jgi:hypothetical protein
MMYAFEMASDDAIYITTLYNNGFRYLVKYLGNCLSNFRCCGVDVTDGRDLWSMSLRWPQGT